MSVTAAQVKAFAPEFDALSDALIDLYLGLCPSFVALDRFGDDADNARKLWTCHTLLTATGGAAGTAGPVAAQSVGDVSVTYATARARLGAGDYGSTTYGLLFDQLARRYGPTRWIGL